MNSCLLLILAPWVLLNCETAASNSAVVVPPRDSEVEKPGAAGTPAVMEHAASVFGEPLPLGEALPIAKVLASVEQYQDQLITLSGHVRRACSKMGCWMELVGSSAADGPGCRVTFKDYGFFVPKDAAGSLAKVHGRLEVTRVSEKDVEHLSKEGAHFETPEKSGGATEIRLVATGVELKRVL